MVNIKIKRTMHEKMGLNPKIPSMEIGSPQHHDIVKRFADSKWRQNWGQVGVCLRQGACGGFPGGCLSCIRHSGFRQKKGK